MKPAKPAQYGMLESVNMIFEAPASGVFFGHSMQEPEELFIVFDVGLAGFKMAWAALRDGAEGMVYTDLAELVAAYQAKTGPFKNTYI